MSLEARIRRLEESAPIPTDPRWMALPGDVQAAIAAAAIAAGLAAGDEPEARDPAGFRAIVSRGDGHPACVARCEEVMSTLVGLYESRGAEAAIAEAGRIADESHGEGP